MNVDIEHLQRKRVWLEAANLAPKTVIAYRDSWKHFESWCSRASRVPLPCEAETLALYAVAMIDVGLSAATAQMRITAVSQRHKRLGLETPMSQSVRAILTGARRAAQSRRKGKAALTIEQLRGIIETLDPESNHGIRDRAMLLLGFAAGMRRIEITQLNLADIAFERQGVRLTITHSKTDQTWIGRQVGLFPARDAALCPVSALSAWLGLRGDWPGALFTQFSTGGVLTRLRLGGQSVNLIVKKWLGRLGCTTANYGGHSLRAGFVTAAVEAGVSEQAIMLVTGHTSGNTVRRYVRSTSAFCVNCLEKVL